VRESDILVCHFKTSIHCGFEAIGCAVGHNLWICLCGFQTAWQKAHTFGRGLLLATKNYHEREVTLSRIFSLHKHFCSVCLALNDISKALKGAFDGAVRLLCTTGMGDTFLLINSKIVITGFFTCKMELKNTFRIHSFTGIKAECEHSQ
jgi:hypothetical protein